MSVWWCLGGGGRGGPCGCLCPLQQCQPFLLGSRLVVAPMPGVGCCGKLAGLWQGWCAGEPCVSHQGLRLISRLTRSLPPCPQLCPDQHLGFKPNALKSAQRKNCFAAEGGISWVCPCSRRTTGTLAAPCAAQQHPQAQRLAEFPPLPCL